MYKRLTETYQINIETYIYKQGQKMTVENCPYRLGDAVLYKPFRDSGHQGNIGERCHLKNFPNSIASKYLRNTKLTEDYQTLFNIVRGLSNFYILPKNDELIIHLRLGDVLNNSEYTVDEFLEKPRFYHHPKKNFVKALSYYENILNKIKNKNIKTIYLIGGYHVESNQTKSEEYVDKLINFFQKNNYKVIARINKKADDDFIFMSNASYFVSSGGNFSKLLSKMVEMNNKIVL
jgi:hypothetical protein